MQSLTDKYPPSLTNFLGDPKNLEEMERNIRNRTPILIHGPPGIGKTTTARLIAKKLGLQIFYFNASDERRKDDVNKILQQVNQKGFVESIFILDEIDGFRQWSLLNKILKQAVSDAVVLIANDYYKINDSVRRKCTVIQFKPPYVVKVRKYIKEIARKERLEYKQEAVSRDIRASLNSLYGGTKTEELTEFDIIRRAISDGDIEHLDLNKHRIWLIDNFTVMYNGIDLYNSYRILSIASRLNMKEVLKYLPKGYGNPEYPNYIRMIRNVKKDE